MTKNQGQVFSDSLLKQLLTIAVTADNANHWTDTERLMPADGVADVLYEALDEIKYHRKISDLLKRTDAAWRAWQSEESRDRGYDRDKCARLRDEYYSLQKELEELEKNQ